MYRKTAKQLPSFIRSETLCMTADVRELIRIGTERVNPIDLALFHSNIQKLTSGTPVVIEMITRGLE